MKRNRMKGINSNSEEIQPNVESDANLTSDAKDSEPKKRRKPKQTEEDKYVWFLYYPYQITPSNFLSSLR